MAKVFISYQSDDRPTVTLLAGALAQNGHSVWWDRGLGADEEWHKQIAEQLASSEVVLAIWTRRSLDSRWVYSEADEADKDRKLVQATLDGTLPPKPFDRLQCIDLTAWTGDAKDSRLAAIRDAIERTRLKLAGATVVDRALPDTSDAERAWMLICESLEPDDYRAFLQRHGNSPHAKFAQKNLHQLETFHALDFTRPEQFSDFIYSGPFQALGAAAKAAKANAEKDGPEMRFYSYLPTHFEDLELHLDYGEHGKSIKYTEPKTYKGRFTLLLQPLRDEWSSFVESELREHSKLHSGIYTRTAEGTLQGCPTLLTAGLESDLTRLTVFTFRVLIGRKHVLRAYGLGDSTLRQVGRLLRAIGLPSVPSVYDGALSREEIAELVRRRDLEPARQDSGPRTSSSRRDASQGAARRSGGGAGWIVALLLVGALGAGIYVTQTSGLLPFGLGRADDELPFTVEPFQPDGVLVARNTGSNYRAIPFARDDVAVLAESVAGEALTITGVVRQADGDWYELRLRDGQTAYLKANLSEVVALRESPGLQADPDLLPPGTTTPTETQQDACPDRLSGPECAARESEGTP